MSEAEPEQGMDCSRCGEPMEPGRVEVHGSARGFLFAGFSLQDLYWYDERRSSASQQMVVGSGTGRPAFACKSCGLLTVDTKRSVKKGRA